MKNCKKAYESRLSTLQLYSIWKDYKRKNSILVKSLFVDQLKKQFLNNCDFICDEKQALDLIGFHISLLEAGIPHFEDYSWVKYFEPFKQKGLFILPKYDSVYLNLFILNMQQKHVIYLNLTREQKAKLCIIGLLKVKKDRELIKEIKI